MAVRDSIFGSRSEERGFRFIEHTWGEDYVVYPQIPLSALFTPDPKWRDTSNFFFKTSVDYVLCTNEGRPILAIDFDGLGGGFDRDGEYVQVEARWLMYNDRAPWVASTRTARSTPGYPTSVVASA